jgi:hypothetical protein
MIGLISLGACVLFCLWVLKNAPRQPYRSVKRSDVPMSASTAYLQPVASVPVGVVYLIRCSQTGLFKIGMTGDWARRSKQLQVGEKVEAIARAWTFRPKDVEKVLHENFKTVRLPQSEWFKLSDHQAQLVVAALESAQQHFDKKQEDPRLKGMVLQHRLNTAKTRAKRDVYRCLVERHAQEQTRRHQEWLNGLGKDEIL